MNDLGPHKTSFVSNFKRVIRLLSIQALVLAFFCCLGAGNVHANCAHIGNDSTISIIINGDDGQCTNQPVCWYDDRDGTTVCGGNGDNLTATIHTARYVQSGTIKVLDTCGSGYNYYLTSVTVNSVDNWMFGTCPVGTNLTSCFNPDGLQSSDTSYDTMDGSACGGHNITLTVTYSKRYQYTQNYNYNCTGHTCPDVNPVGTTSAWNAGNALISLSCPARSGYLCKSYNNGTGSIPSTGGTSVSFNINATSSLTWQYNDAHNLTTAVSVSPSGASPPAAANVLVSPFTDTAAHLTEDGSTTVTAKNIYPLSATTDRWRLKEVSGISAGADPINATAEGQTSKTFDHQAARTVTWNYEKQAKLSVQTSGDLPAGVNYSPTYKIGTGSSISLSNGANWITVVPAQSVSVSVPALVYDGANAYRCDSWTGTGNIGSGSCGATLTTCTANLTRFDQASGITWHYVRAFNVTVNVNGLPSSLAGNAGFQPGVQTTLITRNSVKTFAAPAIIYNAATGNDERYVLTGWEAGTGNLSGSATGTVTHGGNGSIPNITITQDTSVTWVYHREFRLSVSVYGTTSADADPRECSDVTDGATCAANASATVSGTNYYDADNQIFATAIVTTAQGKALTNTLFTTGTPPSLIQSTGSGRKIVGFTLSAAVTMQWRYDNSFEWIIGQPMEPPAVTTAHADTFEALSGVPNYWKWTWTNPVVVTARPAIELLDSIDAGLYTPDTAFFWAEADDKLYPVRQLTQARITWNVDVFYTKTSYGCSNSNNPCTSWSATPYGTYPNIKDTAASLSNVAQTGYTKWPEGSQLQSHIASVPVNLQPLGSQYTFVKTEFPPTATAPNAVYAPDATGYSILMFTNSPTSANTTTNPVKFVVVKTRTVDEMLTDDENCVIGMPVRGDAYSHTDPEGKNGYVFHEKAKYDGAGADAAHDRQLRKGNILPVNVTTMYDQHPLVVVWYEQKAEPGLNLGWPVKPVRYSCSWPGTPDGTIVIASGLGTGNISRYSNARIYNQPDPNKAGYNPNEEHAIILSNVAYALRNDLNSVYEASESYVLIKYKASPEWNMLVYKVEATDGQYTLERTMTAGNPVLPLPPIGVLPKMSNNRMDSGAEWYHLDHTGTHWAKSANWKTGDTIADSDKSKIVMLWYYPMQAGFYLPGVAEGEPVPLLNGTSAQDSPVPFTYIIQWPEDTDPRLGRLSVGDTALKPKGNIPDLSMQPSVTVIYDEGMNRGTGPLVKLFDPLGERAVSLASVPAEIKTENVNGKLVFTELPFYIRSRISYDDAAKVLIFKGHLDESGAGEPLLLPNVMNDAERNTIMAQSTDSLWIDAVSSLYSLSRNPSSLALDKPELQNPYKPEDKYTPEEWEALWGLPLGLSEDTNMDPVPLSLLDTPGALTAGMAKGVGYVTLATGDDPALGPAQPVTLYIVKVAGPPAAGEIKVIPSDNVFDEKLTLRHSLDFGGDPSNVVYEWYYQGDSTGVAPRLPAAGNREGWIKFDGEGQSITIEGAGPLTLSDNWFMVRYYYKNQFPEPISEPSNPVTPASPADDLNNWSAWAGAPGNQTAQLAEGWMKRVFAGLNLFDARVRDFRNNETSTLVSMLSQIGGPCEGDVALNGSADNLNSIGMLCAYLTVLNRGMLFSVDAGYNYGPANNALQNAATRIGDFYVLLGNEAYADAQDPTIGFTTKSTEYGSAAPTIFAFQNQLSSLLEEELTLLRGHDDSQGTTRAKPVYNRLFWNFTQGDGEVAYVKAYGITDQDRSGVINENDARIMYPQGHGDAWGHYLSAIKAYYMLLRQPNFSWQTRAESVLVAGTPVTVDYLDERKFAKIAAQKAKTGAEIVDLAYRENYVDDPAGQWQGYKDTDTERAWGVDEWARRAGQGALLDWVMANALLPSTDPNPAHTGITRIDRTTVMEIDTIENELKSIQSQIDKADRGLNPLGLAKGVVPFDIDPSLVVPSPTHVAVTHFEQVYDRAEEAMKNTVSVFDYANEYTRMLRNNQDTLEGFKRNVIAQERDYKNRLIEIFGYPYPDDIGAGKSYPAGYDGPDWLHYMYVDVPELTGEAAGPVTEYTTTFEFENTDFDEVLGITETSRTVVFEVPSGEGWFSKPAGWTLTRRAPGTIQNTLSEVIKARAAFKTALMEYSGLVRELELAAEDLEAEHAVMMNKIDVGNASYVDTLTLDRTISSLNAVQKGFETGYSVTESISNALCDGFPKVLSDLSFGARATVRTTQIVLQSIAASLSVANTATIQGLQSRRDYIEAASEWQAFLDDQRLEVKQKISQLEVILNNAMSKKMSLYGLQAEIDQNLGNFKSELARAQRIMSEREEFRKNTAGDVQSYRYEDMAFRVFRNDALQKYRAQFDLAARYVYLAATAYDYETNLLGSDSGSGRNFLTDIVRQRSIGELLNGLPVAGRPGLSDPMARMSQNFSVYKTQLGFNNPQTETNRFSLRYELLRILTASESDEAWRSELKKYRIADLWQVPEFKRYCRPFAPERLGAQPALVIPFDTSIVFGKNFFGWPLSGGDSAYDPSHFATKIRSAGIWFSNYSLNGLSNTPRVYLVPAGADVLRSPSGDGFDTRKWQVVDQKIPVPFPIGQTSIESTSWIPANDSLSEDFGGIRRFSSLRAYHDSGNFLASEMSSDTRLIGRSVWNTKWMLIIPGGTLLSDPAAGLDTFINNISDIKLFFQTYSYSGN
ncbi:MAG: hypothetical protein HZB33_09435 [Nitrospirae bacterium]|nr:hypothetical protein [Nitrospirota bacterium]